MKDDSVRSILLFSAAHYIIPVLLDFVEKLATG